MNTFIKRISTTHTVLGVLSMSVLLLSPATALAQARVIIANAPTAPVPVIGAVNPAAQILNPFQAQSSIGDSSTCAPQCIVSFAAVPAGKRLVITNVSAQIGVNIDILVIEGNSAASFVPKPYATASYINAPITAYFEPGSTPSARFFVQDATQHTSLIVTFVGYYVPIP